MASATQQTLQAFTHWLDEIVARGDWRAEQDFIADTLTIHSDTGTRHLTRPIGGSQFTTWSPRMSA